MYALRALQFQTNHPIIQVLSSLTEDELGDQTGEAINIHYMPAPNTQLLALLQRVKKFVQNNWNIEQLNAEWETPWATFPAEFVVSKEAGANAHAGLLEDIKTFEGETARIYYIDGSQKKCNYISSTVLTWGEGRF